MVRQGDLLAYEYFEAQYRRGAIGDDEYAQRTGERAYFRQDLVKGGIDPSKFETWIVLNKPPKFGS